METKKRVVIREMPITKIVGYVKQRWNIDVPSGTIKSAAQNQRLVSTKNEFGFWMIKPKDIELWLKSTNRFYKRRK
jgi:hypothetical protein